jgi:hypothetical protein
MSNTHNITMDQGSTLVYTFYLTQPDGTPFNASGYEARMQIRRSFGDTSTLVNCTLQNSKLAWANGTDGQLSLTLDAADTSLIRFNNREDDTLECVYDLEIVSSTGQVYKPARGTFTLNREVTR